MQRFFLGCCIISTLRWVLQHQAFAMTCTVLKLGSQLEPWDTLANVCFARICAAPSLSWSKTQTPAPNPDWDPPESWREGRGCWIEIVSGCVWLHTEDIFLLLQLNASFCSFSDSAWNWNVITQGTGISSWNQDWDQFMEPLIQSTTSEPRPRSRARSKSRFTSTSRLRSRTRCS